MAALNGDRWSGTPAGGIASLLLLGPHCTTCIFLSCFLVHKAGRTIGRKRKAQQIPPFVRCTVCFNFVNSYYFHLHNLNIIAILLLILINMGATDMKY